MIAELKDKFNRKISYLRLSVTDECNLKCSYCYSSSDKTSNFESCLTVDEISKLVRLLAAIGVNKVRITGGEPLLRSDVADIILKISEIKFIDDISITTNGILLKKFAEKLYYSGLKRINISLDSLNPETYNKITGGNLKDVLNGIFYAKKFFDEIRINVVLLKGLNDEVLSDFIEFGKQNNLTIRFLELMPVKTLNSQLPPNQLTNPPLKGMPEGQRTFHVDFNQHFLSIETAITKLEKKYLLTPVELKEKVDTAQWFNVDSGNKSIGFIAPLSAPFCATCDRIRVTSDGSVFPCLHDESHVSIKNLLSENVEDEFLIETINSILSKKQFNHKLNELKKSESDIMFIGG